MDKYTSLFLEAVDSDQHREEFTTSIRRVRQEVAGIWTSPQHRYYTNHGIEHCERILEHLWLLTRPCRSPLSDAEIYVLVVATYLHDIGMQRELPGRTPNYIRDVHQDLSVEMLHGSFLDPARYVDLGVLRHYADCITPVIRAHRHVSLESDEYGDDQVGPDFVRIRLLGSLLRLADELELDQRRVDLSRRHFQNVPLQSQVHWFRHAYIKSVTIKNKHIQLNYAFPEQRRAECEYAIAEYVQGIIDDTLKEIAEYAFENDVAFMLKEPNVKISPTAEPLPQDVLAALRNEADKKIREREQRVALRSTTKIDDDLARALKEAQQTEASSHPLEAAPLYLEIAQRLRRGKQYMRAADTAEQAADLFETGNDQRAAEARLLAAQAYLDANEPRLARLPADKALSLCAQNGNIDQQIEARLILSKVCRLQMDVAGAQAHQSAIVRLQEGANK